ncbi:hypothetical protein HZA98_00700 [Candidatus Woesearchaeota archaeon]|nr:hypothetical protein [Candidatus Woesearchaeota archaeon]
MAQTQTPQVNPNKKFDDITALLLEKTPERAGTLRDRMTFAWADHVRDAKNKDAHGKGLADAMYGAGSKYIKEEVYGLTGDLQGNDDFKAAVDADILAPTLGFNKAELDKAYAKEKVVHAGDLDHIMETSAKAMQERMQRIQISRLQALPESDFEAFKDYLSMQAGNVGIKDFDKAKVPTMDAAIKQYMKMMPLLANYKNAGKAASHYKQGQEEE